MATPSISFTVGHDMCSSTYKWNIFLLVHGNKGYANAPKCYVMRTLPYLLTPWNRVLLEKLTDSRLVKKFPALYGTRRSITAVTSARHLSVSWAISSQSMPSHPTSGRSILILTSHLRLGLPSGLFPSGFPTKTLYRPPISPYVLHSQSILFFSTWSPQNCCLSCVK